MRSLLFLFALLMALPVFAQEEDRNYPLGPIGGQYRVTPNSSYARIVSLDAGAPGITAGLQVGDLVYGAFGKVFTPTGSYHYGVSQELGFAVDRAEGGTGALPLKILRPGTGAMDVTVTLTAAGSFGPAYPRGSAKHLAMYESACAWLHQTAMTANGNCGYYTGWTGLALLSHPNWNDTTGAKPYRLSINKIRDYCVGQITNGVYAPVESKLIDGTANPNYQSGLSNWQLGQMVMFLSEYYAKTTDATVVATIQRGAEMCANTIQWWKQPADGTTYSPEGTAIAGIVAHGGVSGDYIHLGWGGGINIVGCYSFNGMAFARRAGMNMAVKPRDGHYFGYAAAPAGAVAVGMENYDHSLDEKFLMQWNWMAKRCGYYSAGNVDDGHVCYTLQGSSSYDAAGRTAGTVLGMSLYKLGGGTLTADDESKLASLKGYISRHFMRQQEAHAYCVGAQAYQAFAMPFLSDREQRFAMDNWRFYYALNRTNTNGFQYFRARTVNDNYLNETHCAALDVAIPYGVANGRFNLVPGFNNDANRVIANFQSPDISWPTIDARKISCNAATLSMPVQIVDGAGASVAAGNYTASWTKISGPGTVTFSQPSAATTNITFGTSGVYRVQLSVTRGTYTLVEPIDVSVRLQSPPAGYIAGIANYQVYTGITGTAVTSLTSAAKYPNSPDISRTVTQLVGNYAGDNYGARLSAVIIPPVTGSYRFYIASDDYSQLKLNATGTAASGATVIASVSGTTTTNQWNKYASQQSAALNLTAGQAVYCEALHKEGTGSDYLSVGWSIDGGAIQVIDGVYLAVPDTTPATMNIVAHPQPASSAMGGTVTLSVTTNGPQPGFYQWRRNGNPIGAPSTSSSLTLTNVSGGAAGTYDCVYTTNLGSLASNTAQVTITDAGNFVNGGLWRDVFNNMSGGSVANLTGDARYPNFPDSGGPITSAASPSDFGEDYGERWTGWLKPTVTGSYRFYLTSDDDSEIWLSTDELPTHKSRILQLTGYTGEKAWSSRSPSAYIALTAGRRYYIEVLHKEGGGGDHCAVAWQRQGTTAPVNGSGEIPSQFLEYRVGGAFDDMPVSNLAPSFAMNPLVKAGASETNPYSGQSLAGDATDPNSADALTYSKASGPAWLSVAADGSLTGTPPLGAAGLNQFVVRATDPGGMFGETTLRITVTGPNYPPSFTSNPVNFPGATSLVAYASQTLASAATDPNAEEVASLSFSKVSGPAWLNVAANGALSGTPADTDVGLNTFTVQVADPRGMSAQGTLRITVGPSIFHFDLNGATAGSGAASGGAWDGSASWSADVNGAASTFPWADGATAIFSAGNDATGAYSVAISGTRAIAGFTARSGVPTLTGGVIDLSQDAAPFTISTSSARIDSPISGASRGIVKSGAGTLMLDGNNTYSGNTTVSAGVLELTANGKLYNGGAATTQVLTISSGGTWRAPTMSSVGQLADTAPRRVLDGGVIEVTGATQSSTQNFTVTAQGGTYRYTPPGQTLTLAGNGSGNIQLDGALTYDTVGQITATEVMQGAGGITKIGAGTLLLNNVGNTFTGNVLISGGVAQTVATQGGGTNSSLGAVSGARAITVDTGTLRFSGNNVFGGSGKTAATIPSITVRNGGVLDSTRFNIIGNLTLEGATLQQSTTDTGSYEGYQFLGTITVGGTAPSTISSGNARANHLLNGTTTFAVADVTSSSAPDLIVSAPLRNASGDYASGVGSLLKSGAGTLRLSAANSYTGTTTVSAGTLELAGNLVSGLGVTVQPAGTLAGTASAAGTVVVSGALAPGLAGIGTLTTGALTVQSGATLHWELGASTTHDRINATSLNLSNSPAVTLRLSGSNPGSTSSAVVVPLIVTTGGITGFSTASFTVDRSAISGAVGTWQVIQQGNTLALSIPQQLSAWQTWQQTNFGPQASNPAIAGPTADPDGDGTVNEAEMHLGLNPNDPNSKLRLQFLGITQAGAGQFRLSPAVTVGNYWIEVTNSLGGPWTPATEVVVSTAAPSYDFQLPPPLAGKFYRLKFVTPVSP